jgi:hypothetical protein
MLSLANPFDWKKLELSSFWRHGPEVEGLTIAMSITCTIVGMRAVLTGILEERTRLIRMKSSK